MTDDIMDRLDLYDFDDRPSKCPHCGGKLIRDWDGDPGVINGTRDWLACEDCGISPDDDAEEGGDKARLRWTKCEVCGRGLNADDQERETGMCIPCSEE